MNAFPPSLVRRALMPALLALLLPTTVHAATPPVGGTGQSRCAGTAEAGSQAPVPADPYPLMAAGWGPESGGGLMASRWAEDWAGLRNAGRAPAFKAITLRDDSQLTLSAEVRLRYVVSGNGLLLRGNDFGQLQLRAIAGADLRLDPHLRVYGEVGMGQVAGRRDAAMANFRNDASLQQLFIDARTTAGGTMAGAMLGRQEFSDGPRQLISLSDGPNLHRSWNGVRLYVHGTHSRWGAFDLRATRLGSGGLDERVAGNQRLQGLAASFIVSGGGGPNTYLEPFWYHTVTPNGMDGSAGQDVRDTVGARLWGRVGQVRFDWTVARQGGRTPDHRRIDAWGLFAVQSLALSESGWKPRLTSHFDLASGGDPGDGRALRSFSPLYASSNYLGEGQFLALSNLLMVAPGITLAPSPTTTLTFEYGHARRFSGSAPVYAGGMRPYAGTEAMEGHYIGSLFRFSGSWSARPNLTVAANLEQFSAGGVLARAGYPSGRHGYLSATYRY
jgi:hypothetical protein